MTDNRADLETFSTLLESVYDAALEPEHWRVFLQGLAAALNAKSGLFRMVDERGPALRAAVYYNQDPDLQEAYRQYYVAQDPVVEALKHLPDVYIAPGEAFLDSRALHHTEFFNDYARPQDNCYLCGGLAMRNDEFTIKFGVQRDRRTGPFSEADAAFIRRFVPHIQRAARLGHLLDMARQQAAVAEEALESLAVGAVLLDENERILHTNHKAEGILHQSRGLRQVQERLRATGAGDGVRLRDTLALVRSRAQAGGAPVPETLLLSTIPGEPQLLVVAAPIPPRQAHIRGPWPEAAVAVYVSNLADAGLLNHEILMYLYGLTEREAQLACALARGHDLAGVSESWGVSRETLRTHLKRVLGKTGTNRQTELVRMLTGRPWSLMHPEYPLVVTK